MLHYNCIHQCRACTMRPIDHRRPSRAVRGDHMIFEVIDPVTIMFLLLAGLGLIMAVAYGRM